MTPELEAVRAITQKRSLHTCNSLCQSNLAFRIVLEQGLTWALHGTKVLIGKSLVDHKLQEG